MSTTTAILFNSPALHSLKRDQLVKLCKIHSLKANGKNVELIERLKAKASELPPEALVWQDSEDEAELTAKLDAMVSPTPAVRPSEQWEMVMDDIEEEDETSSNANTLRSMKSVRTIGTAGEFGTGPSKPSVKGSLRAIASSFGIKRGGSSKNAMTADVGTTKSLPMLPSEEGRFAAGSASSHLLPSEPAPEPIPGNPSRPGAPAPVNARLSTGTGAGATTTIRLISMTSTAPSMPTPPRLKPYQTAFDLDMGSPSVAAKKWPASPEKPGTTRLYPAVPYEDMRPTASPAWKTSTFNLQVDTPSKATPYKQFPPDGVTDMFSPTKPPSERRQSRLSVAHDQPFLFGSPNPRHSMSNTQFGGAAAEVLEEMNRRLAEAGVQKVEKTILEMDKKPATDVAGSSKAKEAAQADRFAKAHDNAFNKMDSIANHYAARRPGPPASKKRKSDVLGVAPAPGAKRKSNVAGTRVISSGTRKNMIPGGFGMEDDDDDSEEDAGDRRMSKRIKIVEREEVHKAKRVSLAPPNEEEDRRKSREREAMRKKIEARRRSSRGRPSIGGRPVAPAKAKGSRFGFFGAAKTLVKSVWNMGAGGSGKAAPASSIPKPSAPLQRAPAIAKVAPPTKDTATNTQRKASGSLTSKSSVGRARSPLPTFPAQTQAGVAPVASTMPVKNRSSSNPSVPGASSMGARASAVPGSSNASSLGGRRSTSVSGPKDVSSPVSVTTASRKRTISTLMAPTASSLAKRQSLQSNAAATLKSPSLTPVSPLAIHNGARSPRSPAPPQPSKIFSQPLNYHGSPNPKNENASLAAVASTLYNRNRTVSTTSTGSTVPPKPKTLIARKPRISRSRVIAKVGQQRAASGASTASKSSTNSNGGRLRSSMGAPRRSLGGVKGQRIVSGGDVVMSAKKRARQSEIQARRKSRVAAGSSIGLGPKMQSSPVRMEID